MAKSNVSAVVHLLPTVNEGLVTTLGSSIASGATVIPMASVIGMTNGSTFVGIIEPGLTNQQVFTGVVDTIGLQITGVVWTRGTNTAHAGGVTIVDYVTGTAINMLARWASIQHNDDGTHSTITATALSTGSATVTGALGVTGNSTFTGTTHTVPTVIASAATITPSSQIYDVTALAVAATVAVPSFTANNGQASLIRIKDNGTAQTLAFAVGYSNVSGLATPTVTVAGKLLTIGSIYNSTTAKWEIQGINQSA